MRTVTAFIAGIVIAISIPGVASAADRQGCRCPQEMSRQADEVVDDSRVRDRLRKRAVGNGSGRVREKVRRGDPGTAPKVEAAAVPATTARAAVPATTARAAVPATTARAAVPATTARAAVRPGAKRRGSPPRNHGAVREGARADHGSPATSPFSSMGPAQPVGMDGGRVENASPIGWFALVGMLACALLYVRTGQTTRTLAPVAVAGQAPPLMIERPGVQAAKVRVRVLGPTQITVNGSPVRGFRQSSLELIAYLAVHSGGVAKDMAIADLWPDEPLRSARRRFNDAVYSLRTGLRRATGRADDKFVLCEPTGYRLDREAFDLDLWEFDGALAEAASGGGLAALERAAGLYGGAFSGGAAYEWNEQVEASLRRRAANALSRIAEARKDEAPEAAIAALERAVAVDPDSVEPYERLIDLERRLGRADAARRTEALMSERLV